MTDTRDRNTALAATFEQIAAELREDVATVYGYDVRVEPCLRERGGVSHTEGWLSFELRASERE